MHRQDKSHGLAQVVVDAPAQPHRCHDGAKVVVQQHQRRGLARHVGAPTAHRNADVRGLERRRVIDAVTGHRHDLAVGLQCLDDAQFLLGQHPGEDGGGGDAAAQLGIVHRCQLGAGERCAAAVQARLGGDGLGSGGVVAGAKATLLCQAQDSKRTSAAGWIGRAASPATPIRTPKVVGTSAAQNRGQSRVSAVTASIEMAMAISASDRSNWSSR